MTMQHYSNYSGLEASVLGFCELCRSHDLPIGLNHSEEAESMGNRGRTEVENKYSWATEAKKMNKLYGRLLSGKQ